MMKYFPKPESFVAFWRGFPWRKNHQFGVVKVAINLPINMPAKVNLESSPPKRDRNKQISTQKKSLEFCILVLALCFVSSSGNLSAAGAIYLYQPLSGKEVFPP